MGAKNAGGAIMTNRLWILPGTDPEMEMIEKILRASGESIAYARDDTGRRASPAVANCAHCVDVRDFGGTIYLVECTVDEMSADAEIVRIDHHRPGDPGFGRPPSDFLRASSIGQVIVRLASARALPAWAPGGPYDAEDGYDLPDISAGEIRYESTAAHTAWIVGISPGVGMIIPSEIVLTAAADHCLRAAYRGECPGVDPKVLARFRAEARAKFQGRTVDEVMADVEATTAALRSAPEIDLTPDRPSPLYGQDCPFVPRWSIVADMRRNHHRPELVDAGTIAGLGYVAGPIIDPDGRRKLVCSGSPEQIDAFKKYWAPSQGLIDIYGDPARGFAGGYLS
jgi:hypothetical protein